MPAIPLVVMGVSAAASAYAAHKQGQQGDNAADMQKSLLDRQSALANQMTSLGQGQISSSKPAMDAAMRYYMTLANGNRSQINTALAPQVAGIADAARGAERGLMAHEGPGAQRDQAMAQLAKQRQGQLGELPMQARTDAMGKLATLGQQGTQQGYNFLTGAAGALGGQTAGINSMFNIQQAGNQGWNQFGQDMFKTYGPQLMQMWKNPGSSGSQQPGPWAGGYKF